MTPVGIDGPTPALRLLTRWDRKALETQPTTPAEGRAAVLMWEGFPGVEGGIPASALAPIARGLASFGDVFCRAVEPIQASVRLLGRGGGRGRLDREWHVVAARDAAAVASLFDAGWSQGDQVAMTGVASDARALTVIGAARLDTMELVDAELLFAAIVDGAGMLIAAPTADRLQTVIDRIAVECRASGLAFRQS